MKKLIIHAPFCQLQDALNVADSFVKYYENPAKWDKEKIKFGSFSVHETAKGTIVVNAKKQ